MRYHQKPLNSKVPSYKQKLQFEKDMKKVKQGEKINPKKIFDNVEKKPTKKKRVQKKKY